VTEQIPLKGFSHQHLTDLDEPGVLGRESDRSTDSRRLVDAVGGHCRSVIESKNILPVAIFTLGRFSILINGKPAEFGRKFPKRPLELLKAIIAQGGREISISRLTVLLWPDVDGDKATRSFDTTLHRLRKILGDDRVLVLRDGKLSLDARYCWVDVWIFETLLGGSRRRLRDTANDNQVYLLEGLTENLLALYQDHFLIREDVTNWSVSVRERLRHKFIHHLIEIGSFWERRGDWEQAIECYQKGIDVDDLVEVFYQRLMNCYLETHRLSEGMLIYRRCRQTLSIILGLQPEPETESLYIALKNSRSVKQEAVN
jgi:DNA-binding SARP family transcriptional activator